MRRAVAVVAVALARGVRGYGDFSPHHHIVRLRRRAHAAALRPLYRTDAPSASRSYAKGDHFRSRRGVRAPPGQPAGARSPGQHPLVAAMRAARGREAAEMVTTLTGEWYAPQFRFAVTLCGFLAYPSLVAMLSHLPPPNPSEGGYFFSLMSIVFGTLTASTISDAGDRLKALRAAAVEEVTLLLPLKKRLEVLLRDAPAPDGTVAPRDVFSTCAKHMWAHTSDLIDGSREDELDGIASNDDELLKIVETLQTAQAQWDAAPQRAPDLGFALDATERVVQARGRRLSLESSSIPVMQFEVLQALSVVLVLAYCYLTLDKAPPPHLLGYVQDASGIHVDASFGVHALFAFICGALAVFNSLASDLNRPFHGDFKLESSTVVASLKQLRAGLAPHLGRNHIALSPKARVSTSPGGRAAKPTKFFA